MSNNENVGSSVNAVNLNSTISCLMEKLNDDRVAFVGKNSSWNIELQ